MKQSKLEALWVIYDTQENCFIKFGTKAAWVTSGAAKNAWNCHNYNWPDKTVTFNEQSRYVVMNVFDEHAWKIQRVWVGED